VRGNQKISLFAIQYDTQTIQAKQLHHFSVLSPFTSAHCDIGQNVLHSSQIEFLRHSVETRHHLTSSSSQNASSDVEIGTSRWSLVSVE